jgi:hypothetical protein
LTNQSTLVDYGIETQCEIHIMPRQVLISYRDYFPNTEYFRIVNPWILFDIAQPWSMSLAESHLSLRSSPRALTGRRTASSSLKY